MSLAPFMNLLALLVMPFVLTGLIQRVKSLWSGRKGPPILQSAYDALRLLRKSSVYSTITTPIFRIAPWLFLLSALGSASITPLLGAAPLASFPFDFVWFAYVWALGRVALMLAALDTGSSFEGMGVAREATFATLLEPALFLVTGSLCLNAGTQTLQAALVPHWSFGDASLFVSFFSAVALFIVLQAETARIPIDDPATHLELTMVHEVMVLDHSGPELAAIQYGSALKLFVGASMLSTLLNPYAGSFGLACAALNLALSALVAVAIGATESLIARLRLRTVPKYLMIALASASIALLATAWRPEVIP